jgi:Family of unknown function (DUF6800)
LSGSVLSLNVDSSDLFVEILFQENFMSAPSRRPEIRRRRTRKDKIVQLRKRLAAAKTDADKTRLTAKLHKLAIMSPGQSLVKD